MFRLKIHGNGAGLETRTTAGLHPNDEDLSLGTPDWSPALHQSGATSKSGATYLLARRHRIVLHVLPHAVDADLMDDEEDYEKDDQQRSKEYPR